MNFKILIAVILLCMAAPSKATFAEATEYYEKEEYTKALNKFKELAEIGHQSSQYNLGFMYLQGMGVKQDLVKAYAWVKLSDGDEGKEVKLLNEISQHFDQEKQNSANVYFAEIESQFSNEAIAKAYKPVITDKNEEKQSPIPIKQTLPEYPVGAQLKGLTGWAQFEFNLSNSGYPIDIRVVDSFPEDLFVKVSIKAIKRWRFEPLDSSDNYSYKLDFRLDVGAYQYDGLEELKEKAISGDASAQYLYGRYGDYSGGKQKFSSASWYYEAAQNGALNAQYELAEKLLNGNGCEVDPDKAVNWLTHSARNDFALSQFKLAQLAYSNKNKEKGLSWLSKSLRSNIDNSSLDSEQTAYELVHYIYINHIEGIEPNLILEQLESIDEDTIINPVNYYQYYSNVYRALGDFEEALDYQEEAIEGLEDLGEEHIPQDMLENLAYLESKVS